MVDKRIATLMVSRNNQHGQAQSHQRTLAMRSVSRRYNSWSIALV